MSFFASLSASFAVYSSVYFGVLFCPLSMCLHPLPFLSPYLCFIVYIVYDGSVRPVSLQMTTWILPHVCLLIPFSNQRWTSFTHLLQFCSPRFPSCLTSCLPLTLPTHTHTTHVHSDDPCVSCLRPGVLSNDLSLSLERQSSHRRTCEEQLLFLLSLICFRVYLCVVWDREEIYLSND